MKRSTLLGGLVLGLSAAVALGAVAPDVEAGSKRRGHDKKSYSSQSKARSHHGKKSRQKAHYKAKQKKKGYAAKRQYAAPQHAERYGHREHYRAHRPRPVYRHRPAVRYHSARPWYRDCRSVYVDDTPFYFHAGFQVYLGGVALDFEISNYPPEGYAYYDPYCGETFVSIEAYGGHHRHHRHRAALTLIPVATNCGWGR